MGNRKIVDTLTHQLIVGFYNCIRLHSVLGNLPPAVFEPEMAVKNLSVSPNLLDHYSPEKIRPLYSNEKIKNF